MGHFIGLPIDVLNTYPVGNISFFVMAYAITMQFLAYAAITFDRYKVLSRITTMQVGFDVEYANFPLIFSRRIRKQS